MKNKSGRALSICAAIGMLCLILDSRCASLCGIRALWMCIRAVIPSLFPMFVLSGILTPALLGQRHRWMGAAESLLGLPKGGGGLFLLGLMGGFPVGAQCIAQAVEQGALSRKNGARMLGFCNNCSPAFLFGILSSLFQRRSIPMLIFLIQLESAMIAARIWCCPGERTAAVSVSEVSVTQAVNRGIRSIASVCAWVILGGVFTGFLERWLFPMLPFPLPQIITGCLELTGGVLRLGEVENESLRLILCCGFVCFGGISVWLQIQSVAAESGLSAGICVRQKCLQGLTGMVLGTLVTMFGPAVLLIPPMILMFWKKAVEIPSDTMYNSLSKGGF